MPAFGPVKRDDLIRYLRRTGFAGPMTGGRHQFMIKGGLRLVLPNPHRQEIGKALLAEVLRQAQLSREEWGKL
jgi:predicted RNA binding protein YcfA (HicA-like mRNA interferase family)